MLLNVWGDGKGVIVIMSNVLVLDITIAYDFPL